MEMTALDGICGNFVSISSKLMLGIVFILLRVWNNTLARHDFED